MLREDELLDSGTHLGMEATAHVSYLAEEYCNRECERITLVNEPGINALHVEGRALTDRNTHLEERLRGMSPPGDPGSRTRRVRYYVVMGTLLILAAFAFTMIGLDPYRLGHIGILYCLGIALVTPFGVEEFLKAWKSERLLKAIATVIFVAALVGGGLLAVIRGHLLSRKITEDSPTVVIEDAGSPAAAEPKKSFYEETENPLRLMLLLFALAIDLGAGVAFYRARTERPTDEVEYETLTRELAVVRRRLAEIVYEVTARTNAPGVFGARFWRDFYRAMLTQTARKAITKGLTLLLLACMAWSGRTFAAERMNLVVALDTSASEAIKKADEKTPFERNVDGIARLLSTAPPGSRITVIAITKDSIADPAPLLSAQLSADDGYFGERLDAARRDLVRAWRARSSRLTPSAQGTDIIGALVLASELFKREPRGSRNVLVVFSDMRNATPALNLERHVGHADSTLKALAGQGQIADLAGVRVYVAGANGGGKSVGDWRIIKEFWTAYFMKSGAQCGGYSILPVPPALIP